MNYDDLTFGDPAALWLSDPDEHTIEPEPYRAQVLEEAKRLITGDRNKSYGDPMSNFSNTADLWNVQFGHKLKDSEMFTASDVAQAMMQLKMARMIAGPKRDHWVDVAGYAGCGAECEQDCE